MNQGQLFAPILNGGGDSFWKRPDFQLEGLVTLTLTLDQVILHTVVNPSIDLYLHAKFHWNQRICLWTDGHTYVRTFLRTNGRTFETGFIRSTLKSCRPPTPSSLKITDHSFCYASSCHCNQLPLSLCQPHSGTSSYISDSPIFLYTLLLPLLIYHSAHP